MVKFIKNIICMPEKFKKFWINAKDCEEFKNEKSVQKEKKTLNKKTNL